MRLALECTTELLEKIQPFGDFDWVDVGRFTGEEAYAAFYEESSKMKFVLDAGTEVGKESESGSRMVPAQGLYGLWGDSGYLVAPDAVTYRDYLGYYAKVAPSAPIVGVLGGETMEEAMESLSLYLGAVAVPYDVGSKSDDPPLLMALKRALVVCNISPDRMVHLMGFSDLSEFFWYQNRPNVASISTGVPILLGLQGKDILEPLEDKSVPTLERMEGLGMDTQEKMTAVYCNIALLRRYLP